MYNFQPCLKAFQPVHIFPQSGELLSKFALIWTNSILKIWLPSMFTANTKVYIIIIMLMMFVTKCLSAWPRPCARFQGTWVLFCSAVILICYCWVPSGSWPKANWSSTIKQKGKGTRKQSENNFPIVIYRRWFMCEMIIVENCYNCQMLWVTLSH